MQPYTKEFVCPYSSTDFLQICRKFCFIFRKEEGFAGEKKCINYIEWFWCVDFPGGLIFVKLSWPYINVKFDESSFTHWPISYS